MKVGDVMHPGAFCVQTGTPVREIAKRMREEDVGAILVKTDGQLVGIVTDRDIACRGLGNSGDLARMTAKDVMSSNVVCCSPEEDISAVADVMEARKIRRLVVTDDHKNVLGVLSLGDLSHKASMELSGEVLRAVSAHHA